MAKDKKKNNKNYNNNKKSYWPMVRARDNNDTKSKNKGLINIFFQPV